MGGLSQQCSALILVARSEVHAAHAAAPSGIAGARALLLRHFGDHRLGGDEQARDRGRVLQRLRTTLVGSMMPFLTMSTYSPFWASKPKE